MTATSESINHSVPSKEAEQFGSVVLKNIYQLSPAETDQLIHEILVKRGTCQVWVHTHYKEGNEAVTSNDAKYRSLRAQLVSRSLTAGMPVLAFIETTSNSEIDRFILERYKNSFQQFYAEVDPVVVYYVPTYSWHPTPCTLPKGIQFNRDMHRVYAECIEDEDAEWDKLVVLLKNLGLKQVIVSGAYYDQARFYYRGIHDSRDQSEHKRWLLQEPRKIEGDTVFKTFGCVADVIYVLEQKGLKTFRSSVVLSRTGNGMR